MELTKIAAFCVLGLALGTPVADAQETDVRSGVNYFKRVLTNTSFETTSSEVYETFATSNAFVPASSTALVSVRFSAESRCVESGSSSFNWCAVRILIGGTEASPVETSTSGDFAFDSTDAGQDSSASYEAHSMDRHVCVSNAGASPTAVPIELQRRVTNFDGNTAPSFWMDDWTITIEASRGCTVIQ